MEHTHRCICFLVKVCHDETIYLTWRYIDHKVLYQDIHSPITHYFSHLSVRFIPVTELLVILKNNTYKCVPLRETNNTKRH